VLASWLWKPTPSWQLARANLNHLASVEVVTGDGITYDAGEMDAIFINAGVTHPQPLWLDRLRTSGRLLIPITVMGPMRATGLLTAGSPHAAGAAPGG
jgi:protein-L-isoaspartate O-methyltransferase